jgi:hypothetical protein
VPRPTGPTRGAQSAAVASFRRRGGKALKVSARPFREKLKAFHGGTSERPRYPRRGLLHCRATIRVFLVGNLGITRHTQPRVVPRSRSPRRCQSTNRGGYRSVLRRSDLAKASRAPSRSRLWSRSPSLAAAMMCFASIARTNSSLSLGYITPLA